MERLKTAIHGELEAFLASSREFHHTITLRVYPATRGKIRSPSQDPSDRSIVSMGNLGARGRSLLLTYVATTTSPTTTANLVFREFSTHDSPGPAETGTTATPITGKHRRTSIQGVHRPTERRGIPMVRWTGQPRKRIWT